MCNHSGSILPYSLIIILGTYSRFLIQHFTNFNQDGKIHHQWRDIIAFANYSKLSNKHRLLLLKTDEPSVDRLVQAISQSLRDPTSPPADPMWPYVFILDEYIHMQHKATFAVRDMTESEEKRAEFSGDLHPETDYVRLHEVARHALTVSEILQVNVKTLEHIVKYHQRLMDLGSEVSLWNCHQRLMFYEHMIYSVFCRCVSYRDRMRNEIQLAFNNVSQKEARTSLDISKAMKTDGQAMKAISFIALVFLPPTFVSAMFSTTFFDFGTDGTTWDVSQKFYIYWVCIVPITLISVGLWYFLIWGRRSTDVLSHDRTWRKTSELDIV